MVILLSIVIFIGDVCFFVFRRYFERDHQQIEQWVRNPFTFDLNSMDDENGQKDSLIDLKSKAMLQQAFYSQNLDEFWCSQLDICVTASLLRHT